MRMIGRVAIGFAAVAVITTGAYFGIKFANVNSTAGTVSLAQATSQEKKITEVPESDANGAVAESSQQEASDVSVEILKAQPSEEMSQASMLYEANYNIDKFNTDMLVEYPDLQIIYRVSREQLAAKSSNDELTFNFTGVKDDYSFNGNVDAILNDENLIATRTFTVVFEDFTFGQKKYESLVLEDIEKSFKLIIYGYFE